MKGKKTIADNLRINPDEFTPKTYKRAEAYDEEYTYDDRREESGERRSALLLISSLLGIWYAVRITWHFMSAGAGGGSAAVIGAAIAASFVTPHIICAVLAAIFNFFGFLKNSRSYTLTAAILYAVAAVLFRLYAIFVIIQMILSFIGYARMKK